MIVNRFDFFFVSLRVFLFVGWKFRFCKKVRSPKHVTVFLEREHTHGKVTFFQHICFGLHPILVVVIVIFETILSFIFSVSMCVNFSYDLVFPWKRFCFSNYFVVGGLVSFCFVPPSGVLSNE